MSDLSDYVENLIPASQVDKDQIVAEIVDAVEQYPDWWASNTDPEGNYGPQIRRANLDKAIKDVAPALGQTGIQISDPLTKIILPIVQDLLQYVPVSNAAGVTADLVYFIKNWQSWWPEYKAAKDQEVWQEDAGLTNEIYLSGDYSGDTDYDSMGVSNIFDPANEPEEG